MSHFQTYLGSVLVALLKAHPNLKVTALVRNPAQVDAVSGLGVVVVEGKFSDLDLITKHARAADITINTASSDDLELTNAILAGHKARFEEDKKAPAILFHTSGVAVFMDDGKEGKHDPNSKVWNVSSHWSTSWSGSVRSSPMLDRMEMKQIYARSLRRWSMEQWTYRMSFL